MEFIFIILMSASCGLTELSGGHVSEGVSGGVWGGLSDEEVVVGSTQTCYMTVFDYQKEYDWRANQGKESVRCSLVVYVDGKQTMKVPVGEAYETGDDPDMHRIIDGHLYTDYSTDSETVIRKDGKLLFRYEGRESIRGMAVRGEDVYSLGQNRNGEGFSYRLNGEPVISRETGTLLGSLRASGDSLSFAFCESIHSADGDIERYYQVNEGKISQVAVRDDIKKVWDIAGAEGSSAYLASVVGVGSPVLFIGDRMTALPLPQGAVPVSASLPAACGNICVEVIYRQGMSFHTMIWINGSVLTPFGSGMTMASLFMQNNQICCVANPSDKDSPGIIYRCGERYDMPEGFLCMGNGAMSMVNGILHVGLSPAGGGRPILWKDGQVDTLRINGYIASICVQ